MESKKSAARLQGRSSADWKEEAKAVEEGVPESRKRPKLNKWGLGRGVARVVLRDGNEKEPGEKDVEGGVGVGVLRAGIGLLSEVSKCRNGR